MLLTWLIGVPVGVWSAACRGKWLDRIVETAQFAAHFDSGDRDRTRPAGARRAIASCPGWRDGVALDTTNSRPGANFRTLSLHLLLPTAILVLAGIAIVIRHVRASVVEVLDAPFVRAGRGLGIGQARLLFRHVLPVAASPAISLFGFSIASLLSGSLLVEVATGWPGLGPLLLEATLATRSLSRDRRNCFLALDSWWWAISSLICCCWLPIRGFARAASMRNKRRVLCLLLLLAGLHLLVLFAGFFAPYDATATGSRSSLRSADATAL